MRIEDGGKDVFKVLGMNSELIGLVYLLRDGYLITFCLKIELK